MTTKSAKAGMCLEHVAAELQRERAFSVTVRPNGKLRLKEGGADVYAVPFSNEDPGATTLPRQRLGSAWDSSSHASEYNLVPLAAAVLVPSSTGALYAVPSEDEPGMYASPTDTARTYADEWAENAANTIEYGSAEAGVLVPSTTGTLYAVPAEGQGGSPAHASLADQEYADDWAANAADKIEYGSANGDDAYAGFDEQFSKKGFHSYGESDL
jgi:hypothetical protein